MSKIEIEYDGMFPVCYVLTLYDGDEQFYTPYAVFLSYKKAMEMGQYMLKEKNQYTDYEILPRELIPDHIPGAME